MKTLLITGATSGIGKALALHAAEKGYQVIACGRNQGVLDELASKPNIKPLKFDVTSLEDAKQALHNVKCDVAILNAGTCEYVDIDEFESDMFRRVFETNFFGVVHCVEALIPSLKRGNKLVIVDSMARLLPFTRSQAYGASKAALHYFTKSLEVDLHDRGIKVQAVSPGFVETPLTDKNDFDMPMKITATEAAESMLKGIETDKQTVFFPRMFGLILRFMHILPVGLQKKLSLSMREKQ
ncbi:MULTISPECIES: SDR family NAD(P)-dependent oxidoreductase [Alteromonas]|jgi:NAD(P)-dependent dehydrogenase (short-subunit alcohol dehydrogenase family)|uniref:Short chain dehydrogenase family protein n=1 Tax=Alteromonas naphthalenivorans TaxID=715451 RepID=F5ZB01_ALTNA|nr:MULTISPECIES: SDR family NAD(P)-dependent oxidoreductase [Alteromonas]AEF02436.1 Short chain dehydrogenase family protein [Alteromonas naphthalenivorans]MBO7923545.1 SDR family NAD(P)-dependent oxidoreductase [Alteromonas sp. K632G]|tara:strand:+ start:14526 stop:15245 length:720 start_codon:yes stop_codon:yes gene_type:complete